MSKSADEVEHEVEETRARLDRTLGTLQSRLNVSALAEDLVGTREPARAVNANAQRLLEGARENIVPTLLIGAGIGFLLYDAVRQATDRRRLRVASSGAHRTYVRYSDALESREAGEGEVVDRIIATMQAEGRITRERYGKAVRTSHAKSHGIARGELRVLDGLPPELRQGLFAEPRSYDVLVRFAHVPGEYLDDRKVSTPRGMSLKIFGVEGERLSGHDEATQDFLLDTGKTFPAPNAKAFLATIAALQKATPAPEAIKQAVSVTSRATNAVLNAVGLNSANLDFFGHPPFHPLAEAYYSQTPLRYGAYVAKLALLPATDTLRALIGKTIDVSRDKDALRRAVTDHFRTHPAEYEVAIQLCTDPARMPIENASREWPEAESPYRPVARLTLPAQDTFGPIGKEEALSFCPTHTLAAHRPLGSINRARMRAYEVMGASRRQQNGQPTAEPRTLADA